MRFYLGTHEPAWLSRAEFAGRTLFVSARRLRRRKRWPPAATDWALDSGGFSELYLFGEWRTTPEVYAAEVVEWSRSIGRMDWVAVQDWMCEPFILRRTALAEGLIRPDLAKLVTPMPQGADVTVREIGFDEILAACPDLTSAQSAERIATHQRRTVESYHRLTALAPGVCWVPVLQGWEFDDYLAHAEMYAAAGVDLAGLPTVGVGSVCRRQDTAMAEELIAHLAGMGIRSHGFGFKIAGLRNCARWLASSDSLAWSFQARKRPALPGCRHKTCANCPRYALRWAEGCDRAIAEGLGRARPATLFG